jgi:AcrR family transcriptional regulator
MAKRTVAKPRATGVQLGGDVARNMIMFGASRVFATKGVRATSVEDLLEAGQVSRRTFYRFFKSKDDVALAMYTLGTSSLIEGCRRAVSRDADLLTQLERFVEIHLSNARTVGRLIYVLGGEAHRLESPLHARRMEVHDAIGAMICEHPAAGHVDPWLVKTILFAVEAMVRQVLQEGDEGRRVTSESIDRAKRVLMRVVTATVEGSGSRIAPMPTISGNGKGR